MHDRAIDLAGQILQGMLDVLRHAPFARPCAVAELPSGMAGRSIRIGKQSDFLEVWLQIGVLADNVTQRRKGISECSERLGARRPNGPVGTEKAKVSGTDFLALGLDGG